MNAPVTTPSQLEPLCFPLWGSRLIEASAGTGKTYTIAALYVRLVLGHGEGAAYARSLTPPEILVVTFTDAATKELRDRIRVRLSEAAGYFLGAHDAGDEFLQELRAGYPPDAWPGCARKLQLAAEWMDEAAVSTIHGWCNRMLKEHAFDSDSLFTQALETDQSELLGEVVRDYWRCFMYPLPEAEAARVLGWWPSPDALQKDLHNLLEHTQLLGDAPTPVASMVAASEAKAQVLTDLKAPWGVWVDQLQALLDGARDKKQFNGTKLKKNNYDAWLSILRAWRDNPAADKLPLTDAAWTRLCPAGLAEIWKEGSPTPQHPALDALVNLRPALNGLPDARTDLLRHGARWVAERFALEQVRRAQMGFDELLTRLHAALRGPNGPRLAEVIRSQFPVALIDEFQDTDGVQYDIFDTVYDVDGNDRGTALILIGDPKQAIYAFRGADIYTYLAARAATEGRHYTLKRNYRSTHAMVAATNRCFHIAETREAGEGAFLFRTSDKNQVPFVAADAAGRKEAWRVEGQDMPALTAWCLPTDGGSLGKGTYRQRMAEVCASEMVRLLNLGQQGLAGFATGETLDSLRPAHLAVLVNSGTEAEIIRGALAARGVRSVYLSEKESVFQRPQAAELQFWLAACAEPDDSRCLRAALATPTLGLGWDALDHLNRNELAWENRVMQFREYRACWQRQGVLPMLRRLLNDFQVPARLLGPAGGDGERILTDVLHLAELLQQASTLLEGEHALIRYLAEQRQAADSGQGDARQIRLESDADLVKVVTVHKSKGLEYPLVFLPFAAAFRAATPKDLPLKWHDEAGALQVALSADDAVLVRADHDRLGEDLRKLYVALTRARYATWVGAGPLEGMEQGALGYLLGGGQALAPDALAAALEALARDCTNIQLMLDPVTSDENFTARHGPAGKGAARTPTRAVGEHWWIASYSALHGSGDSISADTPQEDAFREAVAATPAAAPGKGTASETSTGPLHKFPRGPEVGNFLHALLQWAAEQGFGRLAGAPALLRDAVARRCILRGWERWIEPLSAWLSHFIATPLRIPAPGGTVSFALAELATCVAEMEFWLAAHKVSVDRIDELVCRHTLGGAARPKLAPGQLNGMLKGFMDLVVEHEGRYFVVDYKSNWLGPDDGAYTGEAMAREILAQRYELQYVLYLLAVHRLLKLRLPDYDYERHVGGALYLFLRGSHAPSQGVHAERPPRELIEGLDALFSQPTQKECA